jgi:hypothetical protein
VETVSTGRIHHLIRPAIYVATASTPISARLRKAGTSTTVWGVKIAYYLLDPLGAVDFTATADFAVAGAITPASSVFGGSSPQPLRSTQYLRLRRRI